MTLHYTTKDCRLLLKAKAQEMVDKSLFDGSAELAVLATSINSLINAISEQTVYTKLISLKGGER